MLLEVIYILKLNWFIENYVVPSSIKS